MPSRCFLSAFLLLLAIASARGEAPTKARPDPRLLNEGPAVTVALSPDGGTLATGGVGRTIRLWDVKTGKELRQLEHPRGVASLVFTPDGKTVISSGGDGRVRFWDAATGKETRRLEAGTHAALVLAISADGKTLAGGGEAVRVWDLDTGKERVLHMPEDTFVLCLAFAPDGKTLAGGGDADVLRLWDLPDGAVRHDLPHPRGVFCVAYSPDGKQLATGVPNGTIHVWEADTGKEVRKFGGGVGRPACWSLTYSADGKTLAGSTAGAAPAVRRWDVATGKERDPLPGFRGALVPITFPAGTPALAGDGDPLALVADVTDPAKPREPPAFHLEDDEFQALWADLAGDDRSRAAEAVFTLAADPRQTLPYLRKHIKPEPPFPPVAQLIADLDDNRFAVRRKAALELERMGRIAERPLRDALKNKPPLEVTNRIEQLLERIERGLLPPEQLRAQRAVRVLEQLGTPEAKEILESLTKGAGEGWLAREAKAALKRLGE